MARARAKAAPEQEGGQWPAYVVGRKPLAWLKPYERNARTHSDAQIAQLRGSLKKFGWTIPVLAREDGTIIAGHGRVEAAKREGLTECPVIVATGWSEEQCRAYALADNRIALNSGWDEDILGLELADLSNLGMDLESLGFGLEEVAELTGAGGTQGLTDPDEAPEPPTNPVASLGDLWALGRHWLLCGDATSADDTRKALRGVVPHLMVTDPPYGVKYDPTWRDDAGGQFGDGKTKMRGKVANDDKADWREAWALFPGDVAYVWSAPGGLQVKSYISLVESGFEPRYQIIWRKSHFVLSRGNYHWQHEPCWYAVRKGAKSHWMGDRKQSSIWDIAGMNPAGRNRDAGNEKTEHGTQKPVECMKRPIENNSSPGQAVYEPFSGSGTTIIAAEMTGRACHAIEIDPAYVDVAIKRWEAFTGSKATLADDGRTFDEIAAERLARAA